MICAPRRIPTVPARSRQLHLTAIARLLQQLPRGGLSRIFAGADPSTRQLEQNRLWTWVELLHQEHSLAGSQRQHTDTARLLLDLELGFCSVGKHKSFASTGDSLGKMALPGKTFLCGSTRKRSKSSTGQRHSRCTLSPSRSSRLRDNSCYLSLVRLDRYLYQIMSIEVEVLACLPRYSISSPHSIPIE